MSATPRDLFAFLEKIGIATTTREHEAVFTVGESKGLHEDIPGAQCKNLFVKDKKGKVFLIVAEGHAAIDLKKVHTLIGASGRVSFGKPEQLQTLLGVEPGSVTPFGLINDTDHAVTVILDAAMMENPILNYHPLVNTATTTIARDDLLVFIRACGHEPRIVAVSAAPDSAAESAPRTVG